MILDPDQDWLPAYGVLNDIMPPSAALVIDVEAASAPFMRPFTLAQHFTRGGYSGSLYAGSAPKARQWRERWLRDELPLLPLD